MLELNDDSIVTLTDEEGNDVDFLMLDAVEYEGSDYVVLLSLEEAEDEDAEDDVVILRAEMTDDGEVYVGIEDQAVVDAVFAIFQQRLEEMQDEEANEASEEE